ncbi:unnamed protein product [Lampetra fluviatilis]
MARESVVMEMAGPETASSQQQPKTRWCVASDQLELLRAMLAQMVELLTASMLAGLTARTVHENLCRWSQIAAWTGDPGRDGEPDGWSTQTIMNQPTEDPLMESDVAAAVVVWNCRRGEVPRQSHDLRPREKENRL